MELEGVSAVAMSSVLLKVTWQVDDSDGFKRTFLNVTENIYIHNKPRAAFGQCTYSYMVKHTLGQIPHPMQSVSEMVAILSTGVTSIHSLPTWINCEQYCSLGMA